MLKYLPMTSQVPSSFMLNSCCMHVSSLSSLSSSLSSFCDNGWLRNEDLDCFFFSRKIGEHLRSARSQILSPAMLLQFLLILLLTLPRPSSTQCGKISYSLALSPFIHSFFSNFANRSSYNDCVLFNFERKVMRISILLSFW